MIDVVGLHTSLAKARLQEIEDLIELGTQREQPRAAGREAGEQGTVRPGREYATRSKHR
jgi:hypothetical protein